MDRRACLKMSGAAIVGVACGGAAAAGVGQRVAMRTPHGTILLLLDLERAPLSAAAFLGCVDAHAYDGGAFNRVVRPGNDHGTPQISVVQGGARANAPVGNAAAHESTRQTGLRHLDGVISLPRDAVGTATGSEFFICVGDQPGLDFGGARNHDRQGFAAFGRVTGGMEIVRRIWGMAADGPSPDAYTRGQMLQPPVPILGMARVV